MTQHDNWGPDDFPCACLVTDSPDFRGGRKLLYANTHAEKLLGTPRETLIEGKLTDILTPASVIMLDTYLLPLLMHEGKCEEVMLDCRGPEGQAIPVAINAEMSSSGTGYICWSLFNASRFNQLNQKLVKARRQLESQNEQLYQLTVTDELTGLFNRRQLKKRAEQLLAQSKRSKSPVSVVVLDIDNFKQINDTHGHLAGDKILKQLASVLHYHARESDVVGRFGGEEFCFVLPDTRESEAAMFALRLHALVSQIKVAGQPLTISIGLVSSEHLENEVNTYEVLFNIADRAMYAAKMAGRNQTVTARQ